MMDGSLLDFTDTTQATAHPLRPLIVDNFAGGGGASTGIEIALGRGPDVAINHDPIALSMHAANHPSALHLTSSVYSVDPDDLVQPGQAVGLAWFSPDCKHHSKAKGGKPLDRNIRDLAWVVVHWAERVRPEVIILENVEEFQDWCPLDDHGKADKSKKGETFQKWAQRLRKLGYAIEWRQLEATRYYLNGVFLTTIENELAMVATDGHRLARYKLGHPYSGPDIIIPTPSVETLLKICRRNSEALISISVNVATQSKAKPNSKEHKVHKVVFTHKNWTLKTRTIDGTYPDWQRVVPKMEPTITAHLTQAHVSRLPTHNNWRQAVIAPDEGVIRVKAAYGGGFLEMPIKGTGAPFCLSASYLQNLVGAVGDVIITGIGPNDPFISTTPDQRLLVVQMPMKMPK